LMPIDQISFATKKDRKKYFVYRVGSPFLSKFFTVPQQII